MRRVKDRKSRLTSRYNTYRQFLYGSTLPTTSLRRRGQFRCAAALSELHTHIIGNPGMGKTTMLIQNAQGGVLFLDPNGHAADTFLSQLPKRRVRDVLFIDPTQTRVTWNILDSVPPAQRPLYATLIRDTIKGLSGYGTGTPVMDRVLYLCVASLLEYGGSLADIEPLLTDTAFRTKVLAQVSDSYIQKRWEYLTGKKDYDLLISSSENKGGEFTEDPRIRRMIEGRTSFDLHALLFQQKIIVLRLPQGLLGASRVATVGSLFLAHLLCIFQLRKIPLPFSIVIDDFYLFDTPILRQLLANGSRLGVSLFLANQYLAQLSPDLRASILGNCSTRIMFRMGIEDSVYLHKTIPPSNIRLKLHELEDYRYLKYADGTLSEGICEPLGKGSVKTRKDIISQSQRTFG